MPSRRLRRARAVALAARSRPPTRDAHGDEVDGEQLVRRAGRRRPDLLGGRGESGPRRLVRARARGRRARWASISCSWRMTGRTAYIVGAVSGASRHETPPKVTCETCWPAPKQSNVTQPRHPPSRSRSWMPHRWSARRLRQGSPAALSTGKSADRAKGRATQHRPKHREQSASSPASPGRGCSRQLHRVGRDRHRGHGEGGVPLELEPRRAPLLDLVGGERRRCGPVRARADRSSRQYHGPRAPRHRRGRGRSRTGGRAVRAASWGRPGCRRHTTGAAGAARSRGRARAWRRGRPARRRRPGAPRASGSRRRTTGRRASRPGKRHSGRGRHEVVADAALVLEELGRDDDADGVAAPVLRARRAVAVAVEAGHRVGAAGLELAAEHVAFPRCHDPNLVAPAAR